MIGESLGPRFGPLRDSNGSVPVRATDPQLPILTVVTIDPRTPVLIGSGQTLHRSTSLADAKEPTVLMAEAIRQAALDAGLTSVPNPDSLRVVGLLSWRYGDPAWVVADQMGLTPRETGVTSMGGNSPQTLVNLTASQIQRGQIDLAILTGGEATRTRHRARKAGEIIEWPKAPADQMPQLFSDPDMQGPFDLAMNHPDEIARGLVMPVQVYPMFESAIRAAANRQPEEHQRVISELWSRLSDVAASNPNAWSRQPRSAEEIRTPTPANRMIGAPYPKLMNSNNDVDMGAALIMCSAAKAQSLGVPRDRWVFVHAGTDCHEHQYISHRWSFCETPAIALGGRRALDLAGIGIDDIDVVDLYSCFPAAVQLGAQSLGLSLDRQLTRTGGLPFAGGPWNNYVMHAIATTMNDLRQRTGEPGLVWANGGYATKHSFGVYSTQPSPTGFRHEYPQSEIDALPSRALADPTSAVGQATIEAYTVMHSREGQPEKAIAACLLDDGRRAWGMSEEPGLATAMCSGEWVGRSVELDPTGTLAA